MLFVIRAFSYRWSHVNKYINSIRRSAFITRYIGKRDSLLLVFTATITASSSLSPPFSHDFSPVVADVVNAADLINERNMLVIKLLMLTTRDDVSRARIRVRSNVSRDDSLVFQQMQLSEK